MISFGERRVAMDLNKEAKSEILTEVKRINIQGGKELRAGSIRGTKIILSEIHGAAFFQEESIVNVWNLNLAAFVSTAMDHVCYDFSDEIQPSLRSRRFDYKCSSRVHLFNCSNNLYVINQHPWFTKSDDPTRSSSRRMKYIHCFSFEIGNITNQEDLFENENISTITPET